MFLLQEHRLLTDQGASPQVASPPALLTYWKESPDIHSISDLATEKCKFSTPVHHTPLDPLKTRARRALS